MSAAQLTEDEKVFAARMGFHMERGLSFQDAARAVLEDDARIVMAFFDRGTSHYFPTPDERGRSVSTGDRIGNVIAAHISKAVHEAAIAKATGQ